MTNFLISDSQPQPIAQGSAWINSFPVCVAAGFPSPAEDHLVQRIDLMAQLIQHPQATFMLRVRGESMRDAGIFDGAVVLVDRAINPRSGHVVIAVVDGEFVCKTLWQRAGRMKLNTCARQSHQPRLPGRNREREVAHRHHGVPDPGGQGISITHDRLLRWVGDQLDHRHAS